MEKIEFIPNADVNRWKDVVQLTGEHEGWLLANEDFDRWNDGFGSENFNLLVAVNKETKETVGSVATAFYKSIDGSEPLMTLGMFFTAPEFRGCGLGSALFDRVLKDPRFENVNWALNGVPQMTKKYASRYGFDKYPDWQVADFEAAVKDIDPGRLEADPSVKETVALGDVDWEEFIRFDTSISGIRRDGFIQNMLQSKNAFSKIALSPEGKIIGVCNIRVGFKDQLAIGPFYAETKGAAENLLKETLNSIPNLGQYSNIFIFPSTSNKDAEELFLKLAPGKVVVHDAMFGQFTKKVIQVDSSKIYSLTEYAMSYC